MPNTCQAITQGGRQCRVPPLSGKSHCLVHDPSTLELRRAAAGKDGKARSAKVRAAKQIPEGMSAADLTGWLSLLFTSVMGGRVEPKVGSACAAIARTLLDAQVAAAQPHLEDLQEQVAVLRAMIDRGDRGQVA